MQFLVLAYDTELARRQQVQHDESDRLRADADGAVHERVVEAVPAGAREEDREPQDQPERHERRGAEHRGIGVAVHHERAELAGRQRVDDEEAGHEHDEADARIGQYLPDEFQHVSIPP